jgi:hypothetical protein
VNTKGPKRFAVLSLPDFRGRADQCLAARRVRHANTTWKLLVTDTSGKADVGEVKHGLDFTNKVIDRPGCRTFGSKEAQERFRPLV